MLYSDVIGQEYTKKALINSIASDSVSHCYLFEGPKNMGKYQLALIFAQSLLCLDFEGDPCNRCGDCKKFNSMNHPDLHIINPKETEEKAEKAIKREDIDSLIESIYIKPYESKRKVYIINNCQNMTPQAANTFLKTLEEPPSDTVIILLTENTNLLLPTIVSRCQVFKFKDINRNEIKDFLMTNYGLDDEKAGLIAGYSNGVLNKAVNIACGRDPIIDKRKEIIEIFDKIIKADSEIIFEYENYFEEQKDNIDTIIEIMMIWVRDVLFVKNNMKNLIINKDFSEYTAVHASHMQAKDGNELISYLQNASDNIKSNVNYKLVIDNMLLKIREAFLYDKGSRRTF